MAYSRSVGMSRKRASASKSSRAKRVRRMMPVLPSVQNVYKFSRYAAVSNKLTLSIVGGTSSISAGRSFSLQDLEGYNDFTALFDQYRITGIMCEIRLVNNPDGATWGGTATANYATFYPRLWICSDDDDNVAPGLNYLREKQNVKQYVVTPDKIIKFFFKPKVLMESSGVGVLAGQTPKSGVWLDSAQATIPHYGIKACLDIEGQLVGGNQYTAVTMEFKFFVEGRKPQ